VTDHVKVCDSADVGKGVCLVILSSFLAIRSRVRRDPVVDAIDVLQEAGGGVITGRYIRCVFV
jgi:hypothetical protein